MMGAKSAIKVRHSTEFKAAYRYGVRPVLPMVPVPYVETDMETAYGSTVRLSRSIRVF